MKKLIVGNWKMQKLFSDIAPYFDVFKDKLKELPFDIGLAPSSIYLQSCIQNSVKTPLMIGAQDVSEHEIGPYTGDLSAKQLSSIGVQFCIVGHSERRHGHLESSELIINKAKRLQEAGLCAIVCIGETLEQKPYFKDVLKQQLADINTLNPELLVLAYEPVWAIGTGQTAQIDDIQAAHGYIKEFLKETSYQFSCVRILYGGSVGLLNAASIFNLPQVGGLLIGGASLNPESFKQLIATLG